MLAQPLVRDRETARRGLGVALQELDVAREELDFEELRLEPELLDGAPRGRDHAPRRLDAPAQRFEHRLTPKCDGLDRGRPLRDSQHAHDVETAAARARDRTRAVQRGDRGPGQDAVRTAAVARAPRRRERAVERRFGCAEPAQARQRGGVNGVRLGLARGIARRRERRCGRRRRLRGGAQRLGVGEHGELRREARVPRAQALRARRETRELLHRPAREPDFARGEQRLAPIEREVGARRVGGVETLERAPDEVGREPQLVASQRHAPCRAQVARRAPADRCAVGVERSELAQMPVCLLQVPADRLLVLGCPIRLRGDPVRQPLVQLCARAAQHAAVGGVADQRVVEAQAGLAEKPAAVRLDQLGAAQRLELGVELGGIALQQVCDRGAREPAPDDRRALEERALVGAQALDARREQCVDGRRHLEPRELDAGDPAVAVAPQRSVVDEHAHELAHEEGVALARREHAPDQRGGQLLGADRVGGEPRGRARLQPGEHHHLGHYTAWCRQRRAQLAELGARAEQDEERHAARPLHQVLGQVEEQRLGPLHVVDDQHDGPRRGQRREQPPHHEERLLGRGGRAGQQRGEPGRQPRALRLRAGHDRVDRRADRLGLVRVAESEPLAQRRGDGREAAATRRIAARRQHDRAVAHAPRELGQQARLAEPGRAEQHGQARTGRGDRGFEHGAQPAQLVFAPHECRALPDGGRVQRDHAIGRHRLHAAAQRERAERLERQLARDQPLRGLAEHHVAVARLLLQARRDVRRVADHAGLILGDDHLARVHRDAQARRTDRGRLLAQQLAERGLHGDRRAHAAHGVVFSDARHAERAQHAVPEQLHDGAAVRAHHGRHRVVVPRHEAARALGVEPLVQRDRADQIGEDDGDHLPRRGLDRRRRRRGERRSARVAEPRVGGVLCAAAGTARRERLAAAAAEARPGAVGPAAARASHRSEGRMGTLPMLGWSHGPARSARYAAAPCRSSLPGVAPVHLPSSKVSSPFTSVQR